MDLPNCCIRILLRITLRGGNDLDILAARDAVRGVRLLTSAAQYSNDPTKTAFVLGEMLPLCHCQAQDFRFFSRGAWHMSLRRATPKGAGRHWGPGRVSRIKKCLSNNCHQRISSCLQSLRVAMHQPHRLRTPPLFPFVCERLPTMRRRSYLPGKNTY